MKKKCEKNLKLFRIDAKTVENTHQDRKNRYGFLVLTSDPPAPPGGEFGKPGGGVKTYSQVLPFGICVYGNVLFLF